MLKSISLFTGSLLFLVCCSGPVSDQENAERLTDFVARYAGKYSHNDETAEPGYYAVTLKNNGIKAEFTVAERGGMHRYNFPDTGGKNLIINLGFAINWDKPYQTTMYSDTPDGLCGNEDCGQMSAWYIFSALGFYPVNPAELKYQLGSPIVQEADLEVAPGKYFKIKAPLASKKNKYIQEVKLNGRILDRYFITYQEIADGGILEFVMGAEPKKNK